jgi:hypothetical protein
MSTISRAGRNCLASLDARHAVALMALSLTRAVNDPADEFSPGVERCPAFGALVNLSLPSVDRPHRREVVRACAQAVSDQRASEMKQPFRIGRGDHDLTPSPSSALHLSARLVQALDDGFGFLGGLCHGSRSRADLARGRHTVRMTRQNTRGVNRKLCTSEPVSEWSPVTESNRRPSPYHRDSTVSCIASH